MNIENMPRQIFLSGVVLVITAEALKHGIVAGITLLGVFMISYGFTLIIFNFLKKQNDDKQD